MEMLIVSGKISSVSSLQITKRIFYRKKNYFYEQNTWKGKQQNKENGTTNEHWSMQIVDNHVDMFYERSL